MAKDRNKIIGERVRFYRTARDMTMSDLVEALGNPILHQQLAKLEQGKARWTAVLLYEISCVLDVDIRKLIGIEGTDKGGHVGPDEWKAEKYRGLLLKLHPDVRTLVYRLIDGLLLLKYL